MSLVKKIVVLILVCIAILPLTSSSQYEYIDTVNVRKDFFYTVSDWKEYFEKSNFIFDKKEQVVTTCREKDGLYTLIFYPAYTGSDTPANYGKIRYFFNAGKELLKVDVWYIENNGCYITFKPDKTFDIYLFGEIYKKNLSYHFTFDSLKYLPLNAILSVVKNNKLDRELFITRDDFDSKRAFLSKVIAPSLEPGNFVEDGARNEFGDFVFIESGELQGAEKGYNCSGFVKEVGDNYLKAMKPGFKWMSITELKEKRLNERNETFYTKYEHTHDPYFGSDWVRNIVDTINSTCGYSIIKAMEIQNDGIAQYYQTYGYHIDELQHIIFRDQQKDSASFYIVVFNTLRSLSPVIPEFYHIAVIVPYFKDRQFYVKVFESGSQTSYSHLIKNQLPGAIDKDVFEKNILPKIESKHDRQFLRTIYIRFYSKMNLKKDISVDEAVRVARIFNRVEYKSKKALIFKVPVKM